MSIHLLGTNHVSAESATLIKAEFAKFAPQTIAIELDQQRLAGLLNKSKPSFSFQLLFRIGFVGFLFLLLGRYVQKKFGKIARLEPGIDMLTAVNLAQANSLRLLLIDRPLEKTLRRLSKQLTWKEKRRLLYDMTFGLIFGKKVKLQFSPQSIPDADVLTKLLNVLRKRYPTFYTVLLDERNFFMAQRLYVFAQKYPDQEVLAVVGAGHVKGIEMYIAQFNENPPKYFPHLK